VITDTVTVIDTVAARRPASIPDDYLPVIQRLTYGLVRAGDACFKLGPVRLLSFGPAVGEAAGWMRPITGGLLTRRPGGTLSTRREEGRLVGEVSGYSPLLPHPLYRLTQLPLHHALTRLYLLNLRGRVPPPGLPAGPAQRLTAATLDLTLCFAVTTLARPAGRRLWAVLAGVVTTYHIGFWCLTASTPGGRIFGQRVVGLDGRRPSLLQAVIRLTALPQAVRRRRALHDDRAGTDVIEIERRSMP